MSHHLFDHCGDLADEMVIPNIVGQAAVFLQAGHRVRPGVKMSSIICRLNKLQKFKAKAVVFLCIPWLGCKHGFVSHHVIENVVAAFIWCLVGYP